MTDQNGKLLNMTLARNESHVTVFGWDDQCWKCTWNMSSVMISKSHLVHVPDGTFRALSQHRLSLCVISNTLIALFP